MLMVGIRKYHFFRLVISAKLGPNQGEIYEAVLLYDADSSG